VSRRIALFAALGALIASLAVGAATASPKKHAAHHARTSSHMLVGINDEADTLYGDPAAAFATLKALRVQVLRVNLYWGGTQWAVAAKKPADATDPGDPAYNWAIYDRLVKYAANNNVKVVFSILFTPGWANGGKARSVPPTDAKNLQDFAYAAAEPEKDSFPVNRRVVRPFSLATLYPTAEKPPLNTMKAARLNAAIPSAIRVV